MPPKPVEKRGFWARRCGEGLPHLMRAMYVIWLTLIATGLVFYTVIGLAHN